MKNNKTIKTEWDLGLLYKGNNDPQIEKDLLEIEGVCANFEKKYKGKDFATTPEKLLKSLLDYDAVLERTGDGKPSWYFHLKTDLNSEDTVSGALATKYEQRLNIANNKIKFFTLGIAKIDKKQQKEILNNPKFKNHKYFLYKIFKKAEFNLSEGEEQLTNLLSQTSYDMWTEAGQKSRSIQLVSYKGKSIPIARATAMVSDLPKVERRELRAKINNTLKSISDIAEAEINAVYNYKKVMDERRGYKKPYSATILGYENDEKSIELLVSLVTKYFHISHRFHKLHAKLLGEKKIKNADRNVEIGKIKHKFDFSTSVEMLREVLSNMDIEYASILDSFLQEGHIDVYPRKGKKGGAYCWGRGELSTYVLLNHNDNIDSLATLAHEMGHAIHTELAKKQPARYRLYPISTAEVASTFFEQVMMSNLEDKLSDDEKIILVHNRISGDINTIFRQIACFNFESELHQRIRAEGQISKQEIARLMNKHMKSYTGPAVEWEEDDGYTFVSWGHIRAFFYVYSYAYGQMISRALFENYKKDKSYAVKIKQFLSAGKSMSPEDIFKSIGIDTSKPEFFESALKSIEQDIIKLEKLTSKKK